MRRHREIDPNILTIPMSFKLLKKKREKRKRKKKILPTCKVEGRVSDHDMKFIIFVEKKI